jgi:hypothetical protein
MGTWTESFIWASMFWGAVGTGYVVYGWKQQSMIPFIAGLVMSAVACFVPALPMSLLCVVLMFGVWYFVKRGY